MKPALRDAFLSALVALGLFVPLIGLRTDPGAHGLTLNPQPVPVAIAVAAVFAGRFLLRLWRGRSVSAEIRWNRALAERLEHAGKYVAPLLLLAAIALPFTGQRYYLDLGVLVLTYVMLGWGLNIVVGLAGLLDLGYVAFYAVGAYSYALFSTTFGLGFWTCLPIAGALAALWGVMLGVSGPAPSGRLSRDRHPGVRRDRARGDHQLGVADQRAERDFRHSAPDPVRPHVRTRRRAGQLFRLFRPPREPDLPRHVPVLRDPGARAADELGDVASPAAAARPRVGSAARGRDRLPLARHQRHRHQAHRVRDRRDVRRLRGRVLRDAPGFHQPRKLHLHRKRHRAGDRGAGRHGQPARRGPRRVGHDRRLRGVPLARRIPDAGVRRGPGADHGAAAARPRVRPHADRRPRRQARDRGGAGCARDAAERWPTRCLPSRV